MFYRIKHPTNQSLFWSDSEQTWSTQDKSSVYSEYNPPTRNLCLGENVYFLDKGQESYLRKNLETWLLMEGVDSQDLSGLTIDVVQFIEQDKENVVYYSYENRDNKLRRGVMNFTARFHPNLLEDVNFSE